MTKAFDRLVVLKMYWDSMLNDLRNKAIECDPKFKYALEVVNEDLSLNCMMPPEHYSYSKKLKIATKANKDYVYLNFLNTWLTFCNLKY